MVTPAQASKRRALKERRREGRGNQGWLEAKGGKCKGMGRNMRRAGEGTGRGREERGVLAVARSCNYHAQAIRHIRHLLTTELAQTLTCGLILSRINYCNAVLHVAPSYIIKKLQQVQNNAARIVLEAPRRSHASPLLRTLHWLPVQQRIYYKVALLTFKVRSTSTPSYLQRNPGSRTRLQPTIDHYGAV